MASITAFRLHRRHRRRVHIAVRRWQRLAIFICGGIVVGAAAVLLAMAADGAGQIFERLYAYDRWLVLGLTPLGFMVCSYGSRRFFPNSGGSGIPQAIAARQLRGVGPRGRLVSVRSAIGKMLLVLVGLVCGASIGREGPTVQIGAAIMFAIGRLSPLRQPGLILAGAGAGVAAAFNTPLAGIVFAIEEMSRAFEPRATSLVIGAVIAAGLTALAIQGDYTYFGTTDAAIRVAEGWIAIPLIGVAGGLFGGLFSRVLVMFGNNTIGPLGRFAKRRPTLFAGVCGLAVALCGLLSGGEIFGTGYLQARALVQNDAAQPSLTFGLLKLLATSASSISGIPGGIFAPSLAVGAGLGADLAAVIPHASVQAMVVLGMVAYFAGVVQAPITAFVIVTEMTNDHTMIVPLMLAAVIASSVSRVICEEGVYHALARNYLTAAGRDEPEAPPTERV